MEPHNKSGRQGKLKKVIKTALPMFAMLGVGAVASSRHHSISVNSRYAKNKSAVYVTDIDKTLNGHQEKANKKRSAFGAFTQSNTKKTQAVTIISNQHALNWLKENNLLGSGISIKANVSGNILPIQGRKEFAQPSYTSRFSSSCPGLSSRSSFVSWPNNTSCGVSPPWMGKYNVTDCQALKDSCQLPADTTAPTISSVTIPDSNHKVGDTVTATITVTSDTDDYTNGGAITGTINNYTLENFSKTDDTTYTASFTINDLGTDIAAASDISVSFTMTDSTGNTSNSFTTAISQSNDAIYANVPDFTLSSGASSISEDDGEATITATITGSLNNQWPATLTVPLSFDDTNNSGNDADYTISASSISITSGNSSSTMTITAVEDNFFDSATEENVTISIGSLSVGNNNGGDPTITFLDEQSAPTVSLSVGNSSIVENGGTSVITATLDEKTYADVIINLTYSGTATSGTDYNSTASSSITISSGSTSANTSVGITATDDATDEGDGEDIDIDISSVSGGSATENGTQQATVTIIDDDDLTAPTISAVTIEDSDHIVGDTVTATIIVTSDTDDYSTGGAITGSINNYTLGSFTKTNDTTYTASFTITDLGSDVSAASDVSVSLTLTDSTGNESSLFTTAISQSSDAIYANLPDFTLSSDVNNIAEDGGTATITATITGTLNNEWPEALTIPLNFDDSNNSGNDTDYTISTSNISITAGNSNGVMILTGVADTEFDAATDEDVTISIGNLSVGNDNGGDPTITINDAESTPSVTLSVGNSSIDENAGTSTITATLSHETYADVTVNLSYSGGATTGIDYNNDASNSITISSGETSANASTGITALDDALVDVGETVIIEISSVTGGSANESGIQEQTITITDDDSAPVISAITISNSDHKVSDIVEATITVISDTDDYNTGSGGISGTINDYALDNLTKINDTTYTATFTITNGGSDVGATSDVSVSVALTDSVGDVSSTYTTAISQTNDAIYANLPDITLNTDTSTIAEDGGVATITATITSSLNNQWPDTLTVPLNFDDTNNSGSNTDYTVSTSTISINSGDSSNTMTITAVADDLFDSATDEDVTISIDSLNVGNDNGGDPTITITDAESSPTVTLSVGSNSIIEDAGTSSITATLSVKTYADVVVNLYYTGDATMGTDYNNDASNSITISSDSVSENATIGITSIDDDTEESDETIIIDISSVSGGSSSENANQQQTISITNDDDNTPPVFGSSPSISSITVLGGTLSVDLDEESTVYYVVVADGETSPTSDEVKAGTGSGSNGELANGNITTSSTVGSAVINTLDDGTDYDIYVVAEDSEPNLQSNPILVNLTTGDTLPTVSSIVLDGSPATNATSIDYIITFGDDVSNVTTDDFTVTLASGSSDATETVTNISGSGTTYTVTVTLGDIDGDVRLDLNDSTDIVDESNNVPATFIAGDTHTTDTIAPTVVSIERADGYSSPTNSDLLIWTITFDSNITNAYTNDFSISGTTATPGMVSPSSGTTVDVIVNGGDLESYNGAVTLSFAGDQDITDEAGNTLDTTVSGTNNNTFEMDNTTSAPSVTTTISTDGLVNNSEQSSVDVSGTAESNSTIDLTFTDGNDNTVIVQVIADSNGDWDLSGVEVDLSGLDEGSITVDIVSTDEAGNINSDQIIITKDTIVPTITGVSFDQTIVNTENESVVSITLEGAETDTTADYIVSSDGGGNDVSGIGVSISSATENITTIDTSGLNDGLLTVTLTLSDAAGNSATDVIDTVVKDATSPMVDSVTISNGNYSEGDIIDITVTLDDDVEVSGSSSTLALTIGDNLREAIFISETNGVIIYYYTVQANDIDSEGITLEADGITLNENTIEDSNSNTADLSYTFVTNVDALVDTDAPAIPIVITPSDLAGINADSFTINGTHSEDGIIISLYLDADNDNVADNNTADASISVVNGNWEFIVSLTSDSDHNYVVVAEDEASNISAEVDVPTITEDSTPPSGHTVMIDSSSVNLTDQTLGFSFADAEIGTNYTYTLSNSRDDSIVGKGAIIGNNDSITDIDISQLNDVEWTLSVSLTDEEGNEAEEVSMTYSVPHASVNATGLFTKISIENLIDLGLINEDDSIANCSDCLVSEEGEPIFSPGLNILTWPTNQSLLSVNPLISFGKGKTVAEDSEVSIDIWLNGSAPEYPFTVDFIVGGSASEDDHNLESGSVIFTKENPIFQSVNFMILGDELLEGNETIEVSFEDTNINAGSQDLQILTIQEDNIAPLVSLFANQNGVQGLLFTNTDDAESIVIESLVNDANINDIHTYVWVSHNDIIDIDSNDASFTINASTLESGVYTLNLTVTDNGSPEKSTAASVYLRIIQTLPILSDEMDSDNDGISDEDEGLGDSDMDGIPDYLDPPLPPNVLPQKTAITNSYLVECDPSAACRLGLFAMEGENGGVQLSEDDQESFLDEDENYENTGGVFDFTGTLQVVGDSLRIAIPQIVQIPANAVYRKYTETNGWANFIYDAVNNVLSTEGDQGYCPPPGDESWTDGLTEGDWCIQLLIEDGGPNDADGEVNGIVVDPGGVSVLADGIVLHPPIANNDNVDVILNTPILIDVLINDSDEDDDILYVQSASALSGTVSIESDNRLRYVPAEGYIGNDTITYMINDGNGGTDTAIVSVSVIDEIVVSVEHYKNSGGGSVGWSILLLLAFLSLAKIRGSKIHNTIHNGHNYLIIGFVLFALSNANSLQADVLSNFLKTENLYITTNIGYADSDISKSQLKGDFANQDIDAEIISMNTSRRGYGIGLGYDLNNKFSIEFGYQDLNEVEFKFDTSDPVNNFAEITPESGSGFQLSALYQHPLNERLNMRLRLGLLSWDADFETHHESNGRVDKASMSGVDVVMGIGLSLKMNSQWKVNTEYSRYRFDDTTNYFSVGIEYRTESLSN